MDKWKELELNKMKAGGNSVAKSWLEGREDWGEGEGLAARYNSRAAALYKDKVCVTNTIVYIDSFYWHAVRKCR